MRVLFLLLICLLGACNTPSSEIERPNIVFIMIDDLGWRDLGYMGSTYYESPHVDALAAQGMVFTNAYSNAPNCAPTRAALMSGQYAPRHGVYTVGTSERGESRYRQLIPIQNTLELDTSIVTMAEMLQQAGYRTGHFGKWHLGGGMHQPTNQGFDEAAFLELGGGHFFPDGDESLEGFEDALPGEYKADYLTRRAVQFIEQKDEAPFFLYLSHHSVHTPIQGKPSLIQKYEQKSASGGHDNPTYAAMIQSMDESVGRIMEVLASNQLTDNTIVVFFSDNGGYGPATSMEPLRGAKGMLYEGGIRVPMIVKWPGVIEPGSTDETPVISTDFYPTFAGVAGVETSQVLDGVDLIPLFRKKGEFSREAIYWHFPAYLQKYRDQKTPWRTTPAGAIRMGDYKLIEFFGEQTIELYNLREDIGEESNLAELRPTKAKELQDALSAWRASVNAPVPTTPNPEFDDAAYKNALVSE